MLKTIMLYGPYMKHIIKVRCLKMWLPAAAYEADYWTVTEKFTVTIGQ